MSATHYRTCNLCEAMCGIEIETEGSEILSIRGDKQDSFSRGYICPKATALGDIHNDSDRIREPMRRTKNGWETISWDEAIDEAASRIVEIRGQHGRNAVATYLGNPNVHNYGALLFGGLFFSRALGTRNRFSATSVDQLPHHFASYFMFGHQLLFPVPDIDRTSYLLILGGNPAASNGSMMTAPDIQHRLKAIRDRGGKIVLVDPRRTESAKIVDEHHFIRPGTDSLFLLGVLNTILGEGLTRPARLGDHCDGWAELEAAVLPFTPERVSPATGIGESTIRTVARELASAESAACYGRIGASTQEFGAVAQWLIQAINVVTGNLDRPGGAMFTRPAVDLVGLTKRTGDAGHYAKGFSRVRKLPEFGGEYPVATLAEEILTPGDGQIRALVTGAGNPVLSTPNGRQLERALAGLDFMVSVDYYLNETTRHAHIILPPTSALEHDHYDLIFHILAVRNTAKHSPPLFAPRKGAMHEWEIYAELADRIGPSDLRSKLTRAVLKFLGPEGILGLGLRFGPYGPGWNPFGEGMTLGRLKKQPHGVDLGPLQPCFPGRLNTKEGRIQLAPDVLVKDLERVEARLVGEGPQLVMIGRRHLRSNNSWLHNSLRLVKGKSRCTLLMHPDDATRFSLLDGGMARVTSRVGHVDIPVEVTQDMMPGVVSMPHGWGHHRPDTRLSTASEHAGTSLNDLTDDLAVDLLSGNAAFNGLPVTVVPAPAVG